MTRRHSILTALLAGAPASLVRAEATNEVAETPWELSPLGGFEFRSVYDHASGTADSFLRVGGKEQLWIRADDMNERSYRPEIHVSPDERFAFLVQVAGSTKTGAYLYELDPKTRQATKLHALFDKTRAEACRFHGIEDHFHHFDLRFLTWSIASDAALFSATGSAAPQPGMGPMVFTVTTADGKVAAAKDFEEHNRGTMSPRR